VPTVGPTGVYFNVSPAGRRHCSLIVCNSRV